VPFPDTPVVPIMIRKQRRSRSGRPNPSEEATPMLSPLRWAAIPILVLGGLLASEPAAAWASKAGPPPTPPRKVQDEAHLFSGPARQQADAVVADIKHTYGKDFL